MNATRRPRLVVVGESELDGMRLELAALIAEGHELATLIVTIARRAQVLLAAGHSPTHLLDELERLGLRHQTRMTAAAAHLRPDDACPDGLAYAPHGRAA